jgi:hypothetical protein
VYVGHAALALLVKSRRPRIAIALLVPVAFGPDWVQWCFQLFNMNNRELSHSLPAVFGCGVVAAIAYGVLARAPVADAIIVALLWIAHWPADFITGTKPTWPGGPSVGLLLYDHPYADIAVESILTVLCWLAYRAALPGERRNAGIVWAMLAGLIGMQCLFSYIQGPMMS